MRRRPLFVSLAFAVLSALTLGCSEEGATPVDLTTGGGPTTTTTLGAAGSGAGGPATPHAVGENPQARAYAERQCLDNPEQAQGVIRIVDPSNQTVVGEVVVECADVRNGTATTVSVPPPSSPS